jgi:hypothetical protein
VGWAERNAGVSRLRDSLRLSGSALNTEGLESSGRVMMKAAEVIESLGQSVGSHGADANFLRGERRAEDEGDEGLVVDETVRMRVEGVGESTVRDPFQSR